MPETHDNHRRVAITLARPPPAPPPDFPMLGVALLFIGAVLIVNGLSLAGRIAPRDTVALNLLVGLLALFTNLLGLVRAGGTPDYLASAGGLLFAFTYLYAAATHWFGLKGEGLGWYSGFVAISALVFAAAQQDWRMATLWLLWASLWLLFFVSLGLGRRLRLLPHYTVACGVGTCWAPGLLMLTGRW
ncbi:AmiS/UreI family transporter [Comamonas odontotermitis]|uniref:AmiS/UreI family transporter n=1 Tax=Comamonas odontotermitis TaxID=379895 RepID=UPI001CC41938|nr:AmiS/UreI family transporter [Comamonas odontotermitis]UBB16524.1 AmiS/UreI transporter [Comamonas odontotermitis]